MVKIYWVSRHALSPAQKAAIAALHGEDAEVVNDPATLEGMGGLADYIGNHPDGFVYAVAPAHMAVSAALSGCQFGTFENHPGKRADGQFGLKAVYHIADGRIENVYLNSDPESDQGEALMPVVNR